MQNFLKLNRHVLTRWTAVALFVAVALTLCGIPAHAAGERIMRVGLFYGSKALPTANLANEIGSGYRFGFFDNSGNFTEIGRTGTEKITVCKDSNLYLSGGTFYETPTVSAYTLVGAYHLQAAGSFSTYEQAVGAAAGYPSGFPAYVNGAYVVRFEFFSAAANAEAELANFPGSTVVGASASCYTVVETATGRILFEFDNGASSYLGIMPSLEHSLMAQTWFKGYQYYGGFQYIRRSGNDLTVINLVDEDRYVAGVLPYEFVSSGTLESLKAGAVAVRTFGRATNKHSAQGFSICNTTCCQVYRGVYTASNAAHVLQASQETAGLCAYYNGKLIEALYFSSDGGSTENAINAWGSDYPYLVGKADPYEKTISFGGQSWSYQITPQQVKTLLESQGKTCGDIVKIEVTKRTENGNVNELVFTDHTGKNITYQRDAVRVLQKIPGVQYMSRRFTVTANNGAAPPAVSGDQFSVYDGKSNNTASTVVAIDGKGNKNTVTAPAAILTDSGLQTVGGNETTTQPATNTDGWTLSGSGYGHNIGMSQWGAYAMGKLGHTYDEILKFYYTGIEIK